MIGEAAWLGEKLKLCELFEPFLQKSLSLKVKMASYLCHMLHTLM
jgi:hypothetical protein